MMAQASRGPKSSCGDSGNLGVMGRGGSPRVVPYTHTAPPHGIQTLVSWCPGRLSS